MFFLKVNIFLKKIYLYTELFEVIFFFEVKGDVNWIVKWE
ncbi:hypothetical protein bcere0021_13230 [Bacillus cereus Rock3-42]|nr:hypothetical protein bcere0021_13230 [Bacillus cereus Rock3-42]